jgi:Tol biopolymer transport system component/predicted Ser/Thr protein kinase
MPAQIGPYEITRELGRGGMGVVYLGRDTRLDRDVAIKALPAELASDPACLERFEREAKTLAGLHHPNIAGIYGVEEQDGAKYLVLEYVEGETLADRIDRGPIPVDEALELAAQIAAGVEAAHDAAVIHRDLKPGNIIVTPEGKARVLDFGLARFDEGATSTGVSAGTPTIKAPQPQHSPTVVGTILGTAAYMSPEQARGRRVDKRTDVWSFGVVLHEMLAGSTPFTPFQGETATDTIGAVLHKDFSVDGIPGGTPRMVRHVLQRCLKRDKTRRFQSIGDVRIELEDALKRLEAGERDELGPARPGRRAWVWPVVAACFALATVTGFGLWLTKPTAPIDEAPAEDGPVLQVTTPAVLTVEQITDFPVNMRRGAISPDAATIVYSAQRQGEGADLYRLRIGGATPFRLTRVLDAHENHPAISPDGESIAYWSAGDTPEKRGIFLMGATGESPRRIVETAGCFPAWSPDGQFLVYTTAWWNDAYSRAGPGALWVVDLATRERRMIDTTDPAAGADPSGWASDAVSPAWSPDGTRIAYWGVRGGTRDIFTVSPAGGDVIRITDDVHTDWNPIWGPDGRSIWFLSDRGGQSGIWSIALTEDGRPAGEPRAIVLGPGRITQVSRSADGRSMLALVVSGRQLIERVRFDPETGQFVGSPERLLESSTSIANPDISPDGEWIAFQSAGPQEDITVMRLDGTGRRRLTEGTAKDRGPRWTPDGKTLYYYSNENGAYELWTVGRDTAEARVRPIAGVQGANGPALSPDGTRIALRADDGSIWIVALADDGSVLDARVAPDSFSFAASAWWSPDDRRICGMASTDEGPVCAVLDTETDTIVPVRNPDGEPSPWWSTMIWIDATRILARSRITEPAFVFDVGSGESRWAEDSPAERGAYVAFHADGWLYVQRSEDSSNLWLVTLAGPGDE